MSYIIERDYIDCTLVYPNWSDCRNILFNLVNNIEELSISAKENTVNINFNIKEELLEDIPDEYVAHVLNSLETLISDYIPYDIRETILKQEKFIRINDRTLNRIESYLYNYIREEIAKGKRNIKEYLYYHLGIKYI